jgi:putative tryptophan/tyrosine transport system substrate-binding protein
VAVADPVGAGFVESMARPGANATGFIQFEYSLSGKRLELLKEIAPGVTRAAVLRDPVTTTAEGQPCRTAGARFTAARVPGRGRRRA